MKKVTYLGNDVETYNLYYDGEICAELLVGEDGAVEMTEKINSYLSRFNENTTTAYIQNDSAKECLGVIVDVYEKGEGGDYIDGIILWFEDYAD